MAKKQLKGTIISNKMQKTVVVEVENRKEHPKYKRIYKVHKTYKAHDEEGKFKIGDKVIIEECRPLSKDKKWRVIAKIAEDKKYAESIEEIDLPVEISGVKPAETEEKKENNQ